MEKFELTFRKYHHQLFLYSLKFVDEDDAYDVVQDVFAMVWEKKKYQLDDDYLKAFLFHSVKNACLNLIKHKMVLQKHLNYEKNKITSLELQYYKSSEKSLIEKEDLEKIHKAIDSLSAKNREVIMLSRFDGLKNHQIAEKLNLPVRTVETRLYRALSELRQILSEKQIFILLNICNLKNNSLFLT